MENSNQLKNCGKLWEGPLKKTKTPSFHQHLESVAVWSNQWGAEWEYRKHKWLRSIWRQTINGVISCGIVPHELDIIWRVPVQTIDLRDWATSWDWKIKVKTRHWRAATRMKWIPDQEDDVIWWARSSLLKAQIISLFFSLSLSDIYLSIYLSYCLWLIWSDLNLLFSFLHLFFISFS